MEARQLDAVAEGWEQRLKAYLEDIRRKMDRRTATPDESAQVVNMERTVILYELMMGDVLNKIAWDNTGSRSEENQLKKLAQLAAAELPAFKPDQIADALREASRRQGLQRIDQNGTVRWAWVDYL